MAPKTPNLLDPLGVDSYEVKSMWEILVPTVANDGTPFRLRRDHKPWDAKVQKITGGMTLMPVLNGKWQHEGAEYHERMIPVRVVATREQMMEIVRMTAEHYNQIAVMAYKVYDEVIYLVRGSK